MSYAAGLFDADGSVGAYFAPAKSGRSPFINIKCCWVNAYLPVLEDLRELFGRGSIDTRRAVNDRTRRYFDYRLHGQSAIEVLDQLAPYLKVKQDQALLTLFTRKLDPSDPMAEHYCDIIKSLKKVQY